MQPTRLTAVFLVLATGLTVTIASLLWRRGEQAVQPGPTSLPPSTGTAPPGARSGAAASDDSPSAPGAGTALGAAPAMSGEGAEALSPASEAASEEARRESEAYPWDDFAEALGRELSAEEREQMRDLRKEHGLRLAEARARMMRGLVPRAEFERWRDERAAEFRRELQQTLRCSPEEVTALLSVKLRPSPR